MLANKLGKSVLDQFQLPSDLGNDITYCQMSFRHYIKVHQALVVHVEQNPNDVYASIRVKEIENDIRDIGKEQSDLLKNLNEVLNNFYLKINNEISKEELTEHVAGLLYRYSQSVYFQLNPVKIKLRKTYTELLSDLILNGESKLKELQNLQLRVNNNLHPKQISLLKPKSERIQTESRCLKSPKFNNIDNPIPTTATKTNDDNSNENKVLPPAICNSRINLLNALNKAKIQRKVINPVAVSQYSVSSASSSPTSSSIASSPIVSDESYEALEMGNDDEELQEDWVELNKEDFLKMFGLYTHEHSKLLQSRRSERRRRNVTSTEKTDFHYGKFDLLERKAITHNHHSNLNTNKRGKPILYSPIGTRGFKKRKQSHDYNCYRVNEIKSESSSTSSSQNGDRTCIVCNKNDDLLQICLKCSAYFHIKCHRNIYSNQLLRSRDTYCPNCIHMKFYIANSQQRAIKYRKQLQNKNIQLQDSVEKILMKYEKVENKLHINYDEKTRLLDKELEVKEKMQQLLGFISKFKEAKKIKTKHNSKSK